MKHKPHKSHVDVHKRLKRASGHLQKVIAMIESEQPCLSVAQQLQAVVSAIDVAKAIYVQDHIEHCLADALTNSGNVKQRVEEFKEIAKYL